MTHIRHWLALACLVGGAPVLAHPIPSNPSPTMYLQAGAGDDSSRALVLGVTLPWKSWSWSLGSGQVRGHWDLYAGAWSGRDLAQKRFHTAVFGGGPSLRWRGQQGASPWFLEAGTGLMVSNKHFYASDERMATRWNFASHLGLGMNWGPRQEHELSLRLQHASNAGAKEPNPGVNFLLLRYAHAF